MKQQVLPTVERQNVEDRTGISLLNEEKFKEYYKCTRKKMSVLLS